MPLQALVFFAHDCGPAPCIDGFRRAFTAGFPSIVEGLVGELVGDDVDRVAGESTLHLGP